MALTDYYNNPELDLASKTAQTSATQANVYASASSLLPEKLKQAVMEKVNYNRDLIETQNKAMAEYFATPAKAREKYANIWDPFKREALVAEEKAQAYAPYATATDILGARMGGLQDIINAGTGGFNAAATAAQGSADIAQTQYKNLMDKAKLLADAEATERQLKETERSNKASEALRKDDLIKDLNDKEEQKRADTAATWNDILEQATDSSGNIDEYKVWKIIDTNKSAWATLGLDISLLWKWHQELAASQKNKTATPSDTVNVDLSKTWDKTKYWLSSGLLK